MFMDANVTSIFLCSITPGITECLSSNLLICYCSYQINVRFFSICRSSYIVEHVEINQSAHKIVIAS